MNRQTKMSNSRRLMPIGVPEDYRELWYLFRPLLTAKAEEKGVPVSEVISQLREANLIEDFDIDGYVPDTVTREEAIGFLGVSDHEWKRILKKTSVIRPYSKAPPWYVVRPNTVKGQPEDSDAIYWGSDILRISDFMYDNGLPRSRPTSPRLVSSFRRRLGWLISKPCRSAKPATKVESKAVDEKVVTPSLAQTPCKALPKLPSWPKDLPRDEQELAKMYGPYIFDQVRRISKIKTEEELSEVNQQVWLNILQSDVLGKFVTAAQTKLPRTLTLTETLAYLGITLAQWTNAMAYHRRNKSYWMPTPVKGTPFGKDSLFLTEDIQTLDESGFLKGRRSAPRRNPEVTGRGFKSYLGKAIKNHFKNLLRTRSRRHKERGVDPNVVLAQNTAGTFHKVVALEESTAWEDSLTDASSEASMEDLLDLARHFRRHDVDPCSDEGISVLDAMTRGHTLKGAIRSQSRQKVRVGQATAVG